MSQYGDLNIFWNCIQVYLSNWFYINIAQWSTYRHWSCELQIPSSNPLETFLKSYWNKFLKVIFKKLNIVCFSYICYMLPHLSLSNYHMLSWFKVLSNPKTEVLNKWRFFIKPSFIYHQICLFLLNSLYIYNLCNNYCSWIFKYEVINW